jgi:hypothetical protein
VQRGHVDEFCACPWARIERTLESQRRGDAHLAVCVRNDRLAWMAATQRVDEVEDRARMVVADIGVGNWLPVRGAQLERAGRRVCDARSGEGDDERRACDQCNPSGSRLDRNARVAGPAGGRFW